MIILKINDNLTDESLEKVLNLYDNTLYNHCTRSYHYDIFDCWTLPASKTKEYMLWFLLPIRIKKDYLGTENYKIGISLHKDDILLEEEIMEMVDTSVKTEMLKNITEFKNYLLDNKILVAYTHKPRETIINDIHENWTNVKNKCRTTVNKEYSSISATEEFKNKLLLSEHSPIRLITVDWSWKKIPYWVSTELSRHKFEKFISTQRTDRTGVDRNYLPQNTPVNFDGYANAQHLIDVSRKRLCTCATLECRNLITDLKLSLKEKNCLVADYMCPNCVYRGGCPEFKPCAFWSSFCKKYKDKNLLDLNTRYDCYNDFIYDGWADVKIDNFRF